jgi:N-succinyldiaminopimelate aminotransferase
VDVHTLHQALCERLTARTAAVYVNSPCNPTGTVLGSQHLEAIAELARTNDLWVHADEVYEELVFAGEHRSIAALAPERTLTAYSFSKAYGMAGYRCGYLVGPAEVVSAARRVSTYAWYAAPTPAQLLAERALASGETWLANARRVYREAGFSAADRLGVARPGGSTFLFLDVADSLDGRGLLGFLEDCLDDRVVLAPGPSFGAAYQSWVRLCFTCVAPEVVERGVDLLARRLGR